MVSPRERSRPARRRIAGERSRLSGAAPADPATEDASATTEEAPPAAEEAAATVETGEHEPAVGVAAPAEAAETHQAPPTADDPALAREKKRAGPKPTTSRGGPPNWVLAVLATLLVAALALDGFVVWRELSQRRAEEDAARALHGAVIQAPSVAERAAEAVLSYQHDTMDKDVAQARAFLSDGYAPSYVNSVKKLVSGSAAEQKATVKAEVLSAGVVQASGERSDVLLFVNQTTTSATRTTPQTALNRVVFTMVRDDGGWKVDEIKAF